MFWYNILTLPRHNIISCWSLYSIISISMQDIFPCIDRQSMSLHRHPTHSTPPRLPFHIPPKSQQLLLTAVLCKQTAYSPHQWITCPHYFHTFALGHSKIELTTRQIQIPLHWPVPNMLGNKCLVNWHKISIVKLGVIADVTQLQQRFFLSAQTLWSADKIWQADYHTLAHSHVIHQTKAKCVLYDSAHLFEMINQKSTMIYCYYYIRCCFLKRGVTNGCV